MSAITESILKYISMQTSGALMVSGDWGSGKTYHVENVVFKELCRRGFLPVRVSLFGITDVKDISTKLIEGFLDSYGNTIISEGNGTNVINLNPIVTFWGKAITKIVEIAQSIPKLNECVDIKTIISNNVDIISKIIPSEKTILFFDDLERCTEMVPIQSILGTFNDLIEKRKFKVVVISNNQYLKQSGANLEFKEKVIEKTIQFEPDILSVLNELVHEFLLNRGFVEFWQNQRLSQMVDYRNPIYSKHARVQKELKNIRTLKFALSHFIEVYNITTTFEHKDDDDVFPIFLKSLWATILGLSLEYKNNRIDNSDRETYRKFSQNSNYFIGIDSILEEPDDSPYNISAIDDENGEMKRELEVGKCLHLMENLFIRGNDLSSVNTLPLFDFILSGTPLHEESLRKLWEDYLAKAKQEKEKPAYMLLNRFLKNIWEFSDEEMRVAIQQLAIYVENGDYYDNMSYINAYTFLFLYRELSSFSINDINAKTKNGIDIMYSRISKLSLKEESLLNVFWQNIPNNSYWVWLYEKEKNRILKEEENSENTNLVIRLFSSNISELQAKLTHQYGDTSAPLFYNYPILSKIPKESILSKISTIRPHEIYSLNELLRYRFLEADFNQDTLDELNFIEMIQEGIKARGICEKQFSDILIDQVLTKTIKEIIQKKCILETQVLNNQNAVYMDP